MDRGSWQAIVHVVTRVGQSLATKDRERMSKISTLRGKGQDTTFKRMV